MPRGECRRHGPGSACSCAMGNLYRFVEPVLLYLLNQNGPAHGYELAGALQQHALTDSEIERAALYRTLHQLEMAGHVTSTWDFSRGGPARHVYQITPSGRAHLQEWHVVLDNLAESMKRFVRDSAELSNTGKAPAKRSTGVASPTRPSVEKEV